MSLSHQKWSCLQQHGRQWILIVDLKHSITPEEHARVQRRRGRQALGLLVAILVVVGFVTVLRAGVGAVANLFDDTAQKQEYEDKLEGLVLFDPMPFDGIER